MAIHSSILAQETLWTEEPGQAIVHGIAKESDTTQQLNSNNNFYNINFCSSHFGFLFHNTIFLTALQTHNFESDCDSYNLEQIFRNLLLVLLIQINRRRRWHPTPVLLPGKSHGRRSRWAAVHGLAKSRARLSDFTFTFQFHALEKEMATHPSILAWRIPGMGEPGGLPSMGSHRVGHD